MVTWPNYSMIYGFMAGVSFVLGMILLAAWLQDWHEGPRKIMEWVWVPAWLLFWSGVMLIGGLIASKREVSHDA